MYGRECRKYRRFKQILGSLLFSISSNFPNQFNILLSISTAIWSRLVIFSCSIIKEVSEEVGFFGTNPWIWAVKALRVDRVWNRPKNSYFKDELIVMIRRRRMRRWRSTGWRSRPRRSWGRRSSVWRMKNEPRQRSRGRNKTIQIRVTKLMEVDDGGRWNIVDNTCNRNAWS